MKTSVKLPLQLASIFERKYGTGSERVLFFPLSTSTPPWSSGATHILAQIQNGLLPASKFDIVPNAVLHDAIVCADRVWWEGEIFELGGGEGVAALSAVGRSGYEEGTRGEGGMDGMERVRALRRALRVVEWVEQQESHEMKAEKCG